MRDSSLVVRRSESRAVKSLRMTGGEFIVLRHGAVQRPGYTQNDVHAGWTLREQDGYRERECTLRQYYVYIMTNHSRTLYAGVTNDLRRRVLEHKRKLVPGFTQKYKITHLVYHEATPDVRTAIAREKQIKGWLRSKKIALIESMNP
jgi:putative endonuclease